MKSITHFKWYQICDIMSAWDEYWIYCDTEELYGTTYYPRDNN